VIIFPLFETRTPEPTLPRLILCSMPLVTEENLCSATTTVTEPFTSLKMSAILLDSDGLDEHNITTNAARKMSRNFIMFLPNAGSGRQALHKLFF